MATKPLTLDALCGGDVLADFERALHRVRDSFEDETLDGQARKVVVTVEMKMAPGRRYVQTNAAVKVELPAKSRGGIAFIENGEMLTEEAVRSTDGQMDLASAIDEKVTPIDKKGRRS